MLHIVTVVPYFSLPLQEEYTNTSDLVLGITTRTTDVHEAPNMRHQVSKELSFQEDLCSAIGSMPQVNLKTFPRMGSRWHHKPALEF